jgi:MFS family permease
MFLLIALVLLLRGNSTSTTVLIGIALLSATFIGLGLPAVTSMVADAVETRQRGSFFANRLLASGVGAAVVSLGVAVLLGALHPPNGFTAAYVLAGLAGLGSVACLLSIRHDRGAGAVQRGAAVHEPHERVSPLMWRYAVATFILWFGAAMVSPILTPYILNTLGASAAFIGLQGGLSAIVAISCQRWWGRRVDSFGSYGVLRGCTVAVSTLPALYAVAPTYWFGLGYEVIAAIGWSGYALGSLNFACELAPDRERARYTAINNAAAGIGAFLGPLTGALLAGTMPVRAVLLIAAGVRLLSFFALRFARPTPDAAGAHRLPTPRRRITISLSRRGQSVVEVGEGRTGQE